jgi:hypothetical protein
MAAIIDPNTEVTIFTNPLRSRTGERYFELINDSSVPLDQTDSSFGIIKLRNIPSL